MTEHGDPLVTYPSFAIDDYETPLSVIPMPICHEGLSSDWPEHLTKRAYRYNFDFSIMPKSLLKRYNSLNNLRSLNCKAHNIPNNGHCSI